MNAMRRDQRRAAHAYDYVRKAQETLGDDWKSYKIAIDGLGPAILRNGLDAAFAFLERDAGTDPIKTLFDDLAKAGVRGFDGAGSSLPARIRTMDTDDYMLATREILLVVHWFKRAAQALDKD